MFIVDKQKSVPQTKRRVAKPVEALVQPAVKAFTRRLSLAGQNTLGQPVQPKNAKNIIVSTEFSGRSYDFFAGDTSTIMRNMRGGTPARILPQVAHRLGVTQESLLDYLRLPKSTIKARISKGQPLASVEQDRLYRVNRVLNRSIEVLEDELAAKEWIKCKNRSLGGEAPLSILDTEAGYELVLDTLSRIEYGVIS